VKPSPKGEIPVGDEQSPSATAEREQHYLECMGVHCLYCDSKNINADSWDGDTATQDVSCEDCGRHWRDCYELTGIIEDIQD